MKKAPKAPFSSDGQTLLLSCTWHAETLVEAVNTATGRNITLLASVERVAFAAHVQIQVMTNGRVDLDNVTARARSSN